MTVASHIRRAAELMAQEDPARWARLMSALGARAAYLEVGEEAITVSMKDGRLHVRDGRHDPVQGIGALDRQTILDLVEGRTTLTDALLDGRLSLTADPPTLLRLSEAMTLFVEAAVRSTSIAMLWEDYRAAGGNGGR